MFTKPRISLNQDSLNRSLGVLLFCGVLYFELFGIWKKHEFKNLTIKLVHGLSYSKNMANIEAFFQQKNVISEEWIVVLILDLTKKMNKLCERDRKKEETCGIQMCIALQIYLCR